MQQHYKKLFAIHKQLLKHEIPEDVIPLFFEYLGRLNETAEDLDNKHCFYTVYYKKPYYKPDGKTLFTSIKYEFGHYCNVCKKIYLVRTPKQLKLHCKSKGHSSNLELYNGAPPKMHNVRNQFVMKDFHWGRYSSSKKKFLSESIELKKITLHNI